MREILFRGKQTSDGKWVYGFYIENETFGNTLIPSIIPIDENGAARFDDDGYDIEIYVIPETVGQYTGLTDKNGKKIFEGDILEGDLEDSLDPGAKWRSEIIWGKFGWNCKGNKISLPMDEYDIREGEVIGNIHDNPELLKGSAKNE